MIPDRGHIETHRAFAKELGDRVRAPFLHRPADTSLTISTVKFQSSRSGGSELGRPPSYRRLRTALGRAVERFCVSCV